MNSLNSASLINLLGFTVGVALYFLLLVMVLRHRKPKTIDFLLLTTSILGLFWNAGELFEFVRRDFGQIPTLPILQAISYSALGFLPSVVVYSALKNAGIENKFVRFLTFFSYILSAFASILHFYSAIFFNSAPSDSALRVLTFGALGLLCGLLVFTFRQTLENKAVWITALLIFAVSALHLSSEKEESSLIVELFAHQSSLPLALAILLQDYRFAFADLFLKRAFSLLLLAALAFGLYVFAAVPLLAWHETHDRNDVQAAIIVMTLWISTALCYPQLHKFAVWFVDKIILRRVNYENLRTEIVQIIEKQTDTGTILDETCKKLKIALTSGEAKWKELNESENVLPSVILDANEALIFVPTAESPFYEIKLKNFAGGRKLLSDEIEMLEQTALLAARKIDTLRVSNERLAQELQAQEFSKLAAEAQLNALRAQMNPHFLFNALTTIGYLIQTAPEKAFSTLMKLTQLLRGNLRSVGEFTTLGEEIKLIENYLEIEEARFEERLKVKINVPQKLKKIRIPTLILQPLVENAVKHGISKSKAGGKIEIAAKSIIEDGKTFLELRVTNTGADIDFSNLEKSRSEGFGLYNIEQRLASYYGKLSGLDIKSNAGQGTTAILKIFLNETAFADF